MKNLMISLTLVMLVTIPFMSFAEVTVAAKVSGKTITLSFQETSQNVSQNEVFSLDRQKIVLKDKAGYVLYQESISLKLTPEKNYNLKELPSGEYVFAIYEKTKITLKPFVIEGEEIKLENEAYIFKPTIKIKDDVVNFNLLALHKQVGIRILNAAGEELYAEIFQNKGSVGKRFDFSTAIEGSYTINTSIGGELFVNRIEV